MENRRCGWKVRDWTCNRNFLSMVMLVLLEQWTENQQTCFQQETLPPILFLISGSVQLNDDIETPRTTIAFDSYIKTHIQRQQKKHHISSMMLTSMKQLQQEIGWWPKMLY